MKEYWTRDWNCLGKAIEAGSCRRKDTRDALAAGTLAVGEVPSLPSARYCQLNQRNPPSLDLLVAKGRGAPRPVVVRATATGALSATPASQTPQPSGPAPRVTGSLRAAANRGAGGGSAALLWRSQLRPVLPAGCARPAACRLKFAACRRAAPGSRSGCPLRCCSLTE